MLYFHCTDCDGRFVVRDEAPWVEIVEKVDEHIADCPLAFFKLAADTEKGRQLANEFLSIAREAKLFGRITLH